MIVTPRTRIRPTGESAFSAVFQLKKIKQEFIAELEKTKKDFDAKLQEAKEIISQAKDLAKGDPGKDADEYKIAQYVLRELKLKLPKDGKDADEQKIIAEIIKVIPKKEEIVREVLSKVPKTPKVQVFEKKAQVEELLGEIGEKLEISVDNIKDIDELVDRVVSEIKDDVRVEISRSKQSYHGGGFSNIANDSGTVSTGLDTLKFSGAGVSSVTQTGRTVTVNIASGGFTILTTADTIDDSNTTFVFTGTPTAVVINGQMFNAGATIGGVVVWTNVGATVTLSNPVGSGGSLWGIS